MDEQLRRYFRDVADHARRVDEQVTAQRELLTSILEANLALLGVKQNEVIRGISAWAAIIAVPTFLASIWGMNFTHMPELDEPWGYWVALAMMAIAVAPAAPLLQAHPLALNRSADPAQRPNTRPAHRGECARTPGPGLGAHSSPVFDA